MSEERIPTSEKLAQALEAAGAPQEMIRQLAADATEAGLHDIALRAMNGEYDGTREEAEQWGKSAEGCETIARFGKALTEGIRE